MLAETEKTQTRKTTMAKPRILIVVSSGVVSSVICDRPNDVDVYVQNFDDTDGDTNPYQVAKTPYANEDGALCFLEYPQPKSDDESINDLNWVAAQFPGRGRRRCLTVP